MAITGRRLAEEAAIGIGPPPPPRCCSDSRKHTRSYFESLEVAQLIGDNYAVLSSVEPDREDEVQSTWEAVFRECKKRGHGWTKSPGKTDANRLHYLKSSKWYMMRIDAWRAQAKNRLSCLNKKVLDIVGGPPAELKEKWEAATVADVSAMNAEARRSLRKRTVGLEGPLRELGDFIEQKLSASPQISMPLISMPSKRARQQYLNSVFQSGARSSSTAPPPPVVTLEDEEKEEQSVHEHILTTRSITMARPPPVVLSSLPSAPTSTATATAGSVREHVLTTQSITMTRPPPVVLSSLPLAPTSTTTATAVHSEGFKGTVASNGVNDRATMRSPSGTLAGARRPTDGVPLDLRTVPSITDIPPPSTHQAAPTAASAVALLIHLGMVPDLITLLQLSTEELTRLSAAVSIHQSLKAMAHKGAQ